MFWEWAQHTSHKRFRKRKKKRYIKYNQTKTFREPQIFLHPWPSTKCEMNNAVHLAACRRVIFGKNITYCTIRFTACLIQKSLLNERQVNEKHEIKRSSKHIVNSIYSNETVLSFTFLHLISVVTEPEDFPVY